MKFRAFPARTGARILVAVVSAIAGGAAFVYFGMYDIAATKQHTVPVYWLIEATMRRSVHMRSSAETVPDLSSPATIRNGLAIYDAQCVRCHGAPGIAPEPFALGMTPVPANLTDTARRWSAADIYWVVKHGIKMTGMPAWQYRMSDQAMWEVTAFVHGRLRFLSPEDYRNAILESKQGVEGRAALSSPLLPADPVEGKRAMQQYACATCHDIPGITGATKPVGPPLRGMANRMFIAGVLTNTPENMVKWLMSPPSIDPLSAMPDLGITAQDARNIAAYLGTLAEAK
jgi:mono/diheme cytochrome c family protein